MYFILFKAGIYRKNCLLTHVEAYNSIKYLLPEMKLNSHGYRIKQKFPFFELMTSRS